jgi:hypothetical protein
MNRLCRSNSTTNTRSRSSLASSLEDIVHEEDEVLHSDNESLNPTPSDMDGEVENQLNTIKKPFEINWNMLNSVFDSEKNKEKRDSKSHIKEEKERNL